MVSQRDNSADLFALTTRSRNCFPSSCAQANSAHPLQVQKQSSAGRTPGWAVKSMRGSSAARASYFHGRDLSALKFAATPPMALEVSRANPRSRNVRIQPTEQPSAEDFGGEAA